MDQTAARFRKTFQYPTDNGSVDSLPEVLDEEEQEHLIRTLHLENKSRNFLYSRILLALPLLCIAPYVSTLSASQTSLLSLLSISSLLSTAFLLYILPPESTFISTLDNLNSASSDTSAHLLHRIQNHGPVQQYLPYLNIVLCVVLGLLGTVFKGKEMLWRGFEWLPAGVYAVVLVAKVVMGSVNPETELEGLKYNFKGA